MKEAFEELFKNPPAKYRGTPFWSWNGKLEEKRMKQQIDDFKEMGFGGFHIHSRIGLSEEYLGEKFLKSVKFCQQYAAEKGMYTYLYDEDKWPSGCGGGRATKEKKYRARYLLFSPFYHENGYYDRNKNQVNRLAVKGDLTFLRAYQVSLKKGCMKDYETYNDIEDVKGKKDVWYAYEIITESLPWFNNSSYLDTLNPEAVKKFLEVAYEPYAEILGDEFSKTIPSIFTDEPQYTRMESLKGAESLEEVGIPYTEGLETAFREKCGRSLLDHLPELFWCDGDGSINCLLYDYMNFLADRFAESYAGVLGEWCEKNNIMLTGHLMEESGLETQLRSAGEVMRSYVKFQMPGIDILADQHEYTTAKQVQSIKNQMNKAGVISELYGVTNWDYDFRGHKLQGDWQAALGVSVRVPHLAWMYMGGEAKRDYPAPIDGHSTWFKKYHMLEDYFSRVNLFLAEGMPTVRVGVIHPIESMFLQMGRLQETAQKRQQLEEQFQSLTKWLLFGLIDFDFISEALIPELTVPEKTSVGSMQYQVILLPELTTVRKSTLDFLDRFQKDGGTVIQLGTFPQYMDGRPSEEPTKRMNFYQRIGFDKYQILKVLENVREIDIRDEENVRSEDLIYQMRNDAEKTRVFIAHGKNLQHTSMSIAEKQKRNITYRMKLRGCYSVVRYDAMSGKRMEQAYETDGENTYLNAKIYEHDSVLLELYPQKEKTKILKKEKKDEIIYEEYMPSVVSCELEEPNVVLLDMAEYSLDGGIWKKKEELLKIDDVAREAWGYRKRTDSFPQPWLTKEENKKEHILGLRFIVQSEIELKDLKLAFEGETDCEIFWNGHKVENIQTKDYYVDETIRMLSLSELKQGKNILECKIPFGKLTNLEWFYLLGEFGVRLSGDKAVITELPKEIGFGDYVIQGFPFYGGNFVYDANMDLPEGQLIIKAEEYQGALLEIQIDDKEPQEMFMSPYTVNCGTIKKGCHKIRIRCYGTRINTFGQLHNCNLSEMYFGPKTWRTQGEDWCYEYRLHSCGVLKAPRITVIR